MIEAKMGFTREARAKAYRFGKLAIGRQADFSLPGGLASTSRCDRLPYEHGVIDRAEYRRHMRNKGGHRWRCL